MKKLLSLMLAAMMVLAMLSACAPANDSNTPNTDNGTPSTNNGTPSTNNGGADAGNTNTDDTNTDNGNTDADANNEISVITLSDYFADSSKWEDDGGYFDMDAEKIFFDNYAAGDYAAVRLADEYQNVTYKFSVTIDKLAPVSMDDWTWWDSEFLVIARSAQAGSSWQDDGSQVGYTLTSWGDMSTVFIGRCGYDDAFGEFAWNINDGQPHDIELTVVNNEDNTQVTITLVVDGVEIAKVVDDGTQIKNERPGLYPNAGGLTIRCKWLEATIK